MGEKEGVDRGTERWGGEGGGKGGERRGGGVKRKCRASNDRLIS